MRRFVLCLAILLMAVPAWGFDFGYGLFFLDGPPLEIYSTIEGEEGYLASTSMISIGSWHTSQFLAGQADALAMPISDTVNGYAVRITQLEAIMEGLQHASGFAVQYDLTLSTEYYYDYGFLDHNDPPEGFTPTIGYGYGGLWTRLWTSLTVLPTADNPAGSTCRLKVTPIATDGFFESVVCLSLFDGVLVEGGFVDVIVGQAVDIQIDLDLATVTIIDGAIAGSLTLDVSCAPVPLPAAFWLFGSGLAGLAGLRLRKR